jgi:putative transposase
VSTLVKISLSAVRSGAGRRRVVCTARCGAEDEDRLWADYQAFLARDLSEVEVEYLFVDAVFEALGRHGAKEALLVGSCIGSEGREHLLHLAVGNQESEACLTEFFRHMLGRGLRMRTTVTSDGASGLIRAIEVCFPASIRSRCWFHYADLWIMPILN